jgi:hypothetical protein
MERSGVSGQPSSYEAEALPVPDCNRYYMQGS